MASSSAENKPGKRLGAANIALTSSFSDNKIPPQPQKLLKLTDATENLNETLKAPENSLLMFVTAEGLTHHPSRCPIGLPCADFSQIRALSLRAIDGYRFGFVRLGSDSEALRVRDRLNGRWVYGSQIHVSLAQRGSRDRFWKKKKGVTPPPIERLIVVCESPPQVSANTLRQVEGVIAGDNREVLDRCAIGWCKSPILNANLVEAMRSADIVGFQMMRISGDRVLLIFDDVGVRTRMLASDSMSKWFDRVVEWNEEDCAMGCRRVWISIFGVSIHAWSRETFERVMSHWGNVILMAKETLEPSSFERGRVLIETGVLDRIEERLELVVEGRKFSIRLSETDTFLRGPRCSCSRDTQDSSTDSERMENHSQDASAEQKDRVDVVRQFDKDKDVVEVGGADSKSGDEVAVEGIGTMVAWRKNE
ncbi:hypothetical protein V6N12_063315 [Hibiscus sabdariffa]|uniref:DUF4283 domain-containing protein n=1 Tax=Hibiscus sabdariffa TaxID=183260 RepID=A0ABR2FBF8_9ROSI